MNNFIKAIKLCQRFPELPSFLLKTKASVKKHKGLITTYNLTEDTGNQWYFNQKNGSLNCLIYNNFLQISTYNSFKIISLLYDHRWLHLNKQQTKKLIKYAYENKIEELLHFL